jgi:hypothetical protein
VWGIGIYNNNNNNNNNSIQFKQILFRKIQRYYFTLAHYNTIAFSIFLFNTKKKNRIVHILFSTYSQKQKIQEKKEKKEKKKKTIIIIITFISSTEQE